MKPKTKKKDEIKRDPWKKVILDLTHQQELWMSKAKSLTSLHLKDFCSEKAFSYNAAINIVKKHMPKLAKNRREK